MATEIATPREQELAKFLASPPPRSVPPRLARAAVRQAGPVVMILFGLFFGGVGMMFVPFFLPWGIWNDWQLNSAGTPAVPGRITSAAETNLSINETKVWRYAFEYQPPGDSRLSGESFTTGQVWNAQDSIHVRYLSGNPRVAVIDGARSTMGGAGMVFVLIFPIIGFGITFFIWRARRRARHLLIHGKLGEAKIISMKATNVSRNYQTVYKVELQLDDGGHTLPVTIRCHDPEVVKFIEAHAETDERVFVLYDPAAPKRLLLPETL